MPEHLAIGKNIHVGTESFVAQKTKNVIFPIPFTSIPAVDISVDANSIAVPFRINITTAGFTIKFAINYTGNVEWKATKKL